MKDLISALQIFLKYSNPDYPTHCEHDTLYIIGIEKDTITEDDKNKLINLGFFWSEDSNCYISFRFGSA